MIKQVVADSFKNTPRAILMPNAHLYRGRDPRPFQGVGKGGDHARQILCMNELKAALANNVCGSIAEHPFSGGALVTNSSIAMEHDDEVGSIFDEQPEVFFAASQASLRPSALGDLLSQQRIPCGFNEASILFLRFAQRLLGQLVLGF